MKLSLKLFTQGYNVEFIRIDHTCFNSKGLIQKMDGGTDGWMDRREEFYTTFSQNKSQKDRKPKYQ